MNSTNFQPTAHKAGISILIAEDHPLIIKSITQLLTQHWPDASLKVVVSLKELEKLLKKEKFDVLILDLILAEDNSLGLLDFIKSRASKMKVLVLSAMPEDTFATRVLQLGADGYLSKKSHENELYVALSAVLNGKKYLSEEMQNRLALQSVYGTKHNHAPFGRLSSREFEISMLLIKGKSVLEISRITSIQSSTVCTHKKNIFNKLGVYTLVELSKLARLQGIDMSPL